MDKATVIQTLKNLKRHREINESDIDDLVDTLMRRVQNDLAVNYSRSEYSHLENHVIDTFKIHGGLSFKTLVNVTGVHENVIFNILQSLIIRGVIGTDGVEYKLI